MIFLSPKKLGKKFENDIFLSNIKKNGRVYQFKLDEKSDSMVLIGTPVDDVANSDPDEETNQLIFGSGFSGRSNRILEPTDIYMFSDLVNI
jgi:hypothetical protein